MGTGVMIGAGIFALTGQIAELAGPLFPLAFTAGAIVSGFIAYGYIRMSNAWPTSGGIAMLLAALAFDALVFAAFTALKLPCDPLIVIVAAVAIAAVLGFERVYLSRWTEMPGEGHTVHNVGGS